VTRAAFVPVWVALAALSSAGARASRVAAVPVPVESAERARSDGGARADGGAKADGGAEADSGSKRDAGPPPPVPECIRVSTAAVYSGGGYDHVVSLANGCEKDADCHVATDVAPEVIDVALPAGETRDVVTFRGSPSSEFKAQARCTLSR
jgi:hypothetical protein